MNSRRFYALLIFCLCGGFAGAARQTQDPQSLSTDAPVERELPAGQTHIYRIALSAGQFALVEVEQRGADVSLAASGPDGKEFASVNLRSSGEGMERLAIIADAAGEYILKVISRNPKPAAGAVGRYKAKISELRAATEQDRDRAQAQSICYEAQKLSLEQAPEARMKAVQLYEEALALWRRLKDPGGNLFCCCGWGVSTPTCRSSARRRIISAAPSSPGKSWVIGAAWRPRRRACAKRCIIWAI